LQGNDPGGDRNYLCPQGLELQSSPH
jgi:hypothetical protein